MLVGGDELGRTQLGNNNAYCQDNEVSWVNWDLTASGRRLLQFTHDVLEIFRSNPVLRRRSFFTGRLIADEGAKDVTWIRPDGREMAAHDWAEPSNQVLGMLIDGHATDELDERGRPIYGDTLLLILNAGAKAKSFELPKEDGNGAWQEIMNTARTDATTPHVRKTGQGLNVAPHSLVLLRRGQGS